MTTPDHVRANTDDQINATLDREARERVSRYAGASEAELSGSIDQLRREWDMERYLETNAASIAGLGVMLAALHDRRWLLVPAVVLPFLLTHATQGWCPPVPLLRRQGVRSRQEIDREMYALKALRGDFDSETRQSADAAWVAAGR